MKKLVIHQLGQPVVSGLAPQLLDLLLLFQQLIDEITGHMDQFGPCTVDNFKVVGFIFQGELKKWEDLPGLVENAGTDIIDIESFLEPVLSCEMVDQAQIGILSAAQKQLHV